MYQTLWYARVSSSGLERNPLTLRAAVPESPVCTPGQKPIFPKTTMVLIHEVALIAARTKACTKSRC
jgi:hypothetical protein